MMEARSAGGDSSDSSQECLMNLRNQRLLRRATLFLGDMYQYISEVIATQKAEKRKVQPPPKLNRTVKDGRYLLLRLIGRGSFGHVVEAYDLRLREKVAVKIISKHLHSYFHEVKTVMLLNRVDTQRGYIVRILDYFVESRQGYIVFEHLEKTLLQVLRDTGMTGLPLNDLRKVAWQLLMGLTLLSLPGLRIVHCDLKPDNIMLKRADRWGLKIIDFGSACQNGGETYRYIQSRFYRAPEVFLQVQPYTHAVDLWSVACVLVELYTGKVLFPGRKKREVFARIVQLKGLPPMHMIHASPRTCSYFSCTRDCREYRLKQPIEGRRTLPDIIGSDPKNAAFLSLLEGLLQYDPAKRITALEALRHPFFAEGDDDHVFRVPDMSAFVYPMNTECNHMHHTQPRPVQLMSILQMIGEAEVDAASKSTAMRSSQEESAVPLKQGSVDYSDFQSRMRLTGGRPSSVEAKSKEESKWH